MVILVIVGIAIGLVVVAWLVGGLLPRTGTSRRVVDLPASREQVWAVITDYAAQPAWHPDLEEVEQVDEHGRRWRERHCSGEVQEVEVLASDPPTRLEWRFIDAGGIFRGTWELVLEDRSGGTRLTATQQATVPGRLARTLALIIGGRDATLRLYLAALRERLVRPTS